jgi:hypothetical protein
MLRSLRNRLDFMSNRSSGHKFVFDNRSWAEPAAHVARQILRVAGTVTGLKKRGPAARTPRGKRVLDRSQTFGLVLVIYVFRARFANHN